MSNRPAFAARAPQIAEPVERRFSCLWLGHPLLHQLARAHEQMELEFVVDLLVDTRPADPQGKTFAEIHGTTR